MLTTALKHKCIFKNYRNALRHSHCALRDGIVLKSRNIRFYEKLKSICKSMSRYVITLSHQFT